MFLNALTPVQHAQRHNTLGSTLPHRLSPSALVFTAIHLQAGRVHIGLFPVASLLFPPPSAEGTRKAQPNYWDLDSSISQIDTCNILRTAIRTECGPCGSARHSAADERDHWAGCKAVVIHHGRNTGKDKVSTAHASHLPPPLVADLTVAVVYLLVDVFPSCGVYLEQCTTAHYATASSEN
jgi:hypothetical protein